MPNFNQPGNFDFSRPAKWLEWKDQFDLFRIATKLDKEQQIVQISSVVYAIGRKAHTIYKSFTIGDVADENPERNYDIVMEKLHHYFIPKKNTIHKRTKFNQRCQFPGESVEQYVRRHEGAILHKMRLNISETDWLQEWLTKSYHKSCRLKRQWTQGIGKMPQQWMLLDGGDNRNNPNVTTSHRRATTRENKQSILITNAHVADINTDRLETMRVLQFGT